MHIPLTNVNNKLHFVLDLKGLKLYVQALLGEIKECPSFIVKVSLLLFSFWPVFFLETWLCTTFLTWHEQTTTLPGNGITP